MVVYLNTLTKLVLNVTDSGFGKTLQTPKCRIRNSSGNWWDGALWSGTPVDLTMTEKSATYEPGLYFYDWSSPDVLGFYTIRYIIATGPYALDLCEYAECVKAVESFLSSDRATLNNINSHTNPIPLGSDPVVTKNVLMDVLYNKAITAIDPNNRITQYKPGTGGNQKTVNVSRNANGVVISEVVL